MRSQTLVYNKRFYDTIASLGGRGIFKCYQCGTCTVACPVSEAFSVSVRRAIRYAQLGLEDRLARDLTPWICYACGDCSTSCPRDADPTSLMMALRRYLTMRYDWTGLSRILYTSKLAKIVGVVVLALFTGVMAYLLHGPIILDRVALGTFAPVEIVEPAGLALLAVLAAILIGNIYRMYKLTVGGGPRLPLRVYIVELVKTLPVAFFTQNVFRYCTNRRYWINHLLIFYGYGASFILFAILLRLTQTDEPFLFVHPLSILGVFAAAALIYGAATMIYGRVKKNMPIFRVSHSTDWMFIILLLLVTITGLLVGIFRLLGYPLATYITYVVHLMLVVPFLALEVPFLKWSHLAYRPFALYFMRIAELKRLYSVQQRV